MKLRFRKAAAACALGMTAVLLAGGVVSAEDSSAASAAEEVVSSEAAVSEAEEAASSEAATSEAVASEAAASEATAEEVTSEAASTAEDAAASEAEEAVSGAEETESTAEEEEKPRPEYRALDFLTLGEYKGLTVEVDPVEITDDAIESRITSDIRFSEEGSETFEEGTVEEGDVANIDYEGKLDGVAFDGGTAEGYDLEIGSGTFIPGFEDGLIGKTIGETVDLTLTFPEEYGNEELAGKETVFTVKINSVKRYKELDDALAEALSDGEAKTVDEYRERVKTMLEEEAIESRNEGAKQELIALAADNASISEYPQDLVDYTIEEVTNYYKSYAAMYGVDFATFLSAMAGTTEEDFPKMAEEISKESIKQEFTIGAIAETEKLLPEGDELAAAYDKLAEEVGAPDGASLVAEYGEYTVKYKLMYDAVSDFLFENATVVEKTPEEEASEAEAAESVVEEAASEAEAAESVAEEVASAAEEAASEAEAVASVAEEAASELEAAESVVEEAASAAEEAASEAAAE